MTVEEDFVNTFVVREKRARYAELLAQPTKRDKILDRLNHCFDYVERLATEVVRGDHMALLRSRGAPERCYVIADSHRLDRQSLPLDEAVHGLLTHMFGYVIVCIPNRLALYQPEAPSEAVLLEAPGKK